MCFFELFKKAFCIRIRYLGSCVIDIGLIFGTELYIYSGNTLFKSYKIGD